MSYSGKTEEIPRVESRADEYGLPSPRHINELARLALKLGTELPILQSHVTPGERNGFPVPLSALGAYVIRTCLEEVANELYQRVNGGATKREFAFTHLSPIRPYASPLLNDRLPPIEARSHAQFGPHTDAGFTGPSLHIQRRAAQFGQPDPVRTVWAALAKPGQDVGWDPSTHQLPQIKQNYYRELSITNLLRHNRSGFSDPDIAKHIDGPVFRGATEPGVMTIMMDGNLAAPWEAPTRSTLHYFEDEPGRIAQPWVRFTMLYDDYFGKNNTLLPQLRENLLQATTFEASTAEFMSLREELQTSAAGGHDPYFWFSEQINAIRTAADLPAALASFKQAFQQTHGGSPRDAELMAHRVKHYLLAPGHDLVYAPSPKRDPLTAPVYLSWPGDIKGRKPKPFHVQEPLFPLFGDQYNNPQFEMTERPPAPEFTPENPRLNPNFKD